MSFQAPALLCNAHEVLRLDELRALLRRLRLNGPGEIPLSSQATHPTTTLDALLTQYVRQGYLERQIIGEGKAANKKRGRVQVGGTQGAGLDDDVYEWRWGPRAAAEVGEQAIASFVADFMVVVAPRDDEMERNESEDDEEAKAQRDAENIDKMVKGIEKAAGGTLAEVV